MDEIQKDLPDDFPAKCPLCEFTGRNRSTLAIHYAITHKVIVKLIENATGCKIDPSFSKVKAIVDKVEKPFACPLCPFQISHEQRMDHLCTHFRERLSDDGRLPDATPYSCPKCRFVGMTREKLIRHYGGYHKCVSKIVVEHLRDAGRDVPSELEAESHSDAPPLPSDSSSGGIECHLCDSLPVYKNKSELCKHVSEVHFMEKILEQLPPVDQPSEDQTPEQEGKEKAFKCNKDGCSFSSTARNSLLTHVGVFHRVAMRLYLDVLGISDLPGPDNFPVSGGGGARRQHSSVSTSSSAAAAAASTTEMPCTICGEKFDRSTFVAHVAETHFADKIGAIPSEAPFKCPQCPHFSETRERLLRHYGFYHKVFDKITDDHIKLEQCEDAAVKMEIEGSTGGEDTPKTFDAQSDAGNGTPKHLNDVKDEFLGEAADNIDGSGGATATTPTTQRSTTAAQQCLMCDDCPVIGTNVSDFHKHLSEQHFKERLFSLVLTVPNESGGGKRFRCPECGYEHQYRFQIARHCGHKHRLAKKFYSEVIGEKFDPEAEEAEKKPRGRPTMERALMQAMDNSSSGQSDNHDCKICSAKSLGLADYLKHLSKIHFKTKLLSMVPSSEPFRCPFEGCELEKKDHLTLAVHYGMNHKIALKLLNEMPEDAINSGASGGDGVEAKCQLCNEAFTAHRFVQTMFIEQFREHFFIYRRKGSIPNAIQNN
jgi:hypothetical protein